MKDDNDKKLAFVQAMTKHGLSHFAQGGMSYGNPQGNNGGANGGNTFVAHPGQTPQDVWGGTTTNDINNVGGMGGYTTNNPITHGVANTAGGIMGTIGENGADAAHALGNTTQGIASAFTAQNQYNAQLAPTDYTNYQGLIGQSGNQSLNGYGQAQNIQNQQQGLADQLGQQAQGLGPNVALNQLNQTTGQNVAAQGALMAGQRGGAQNVGMMARQAANNGQAMQQQAVGQGATLRAQQQIAAQQALAQQQGIMGQQNIGEQGVNNQLFGTAATAQNAQNNTNVSNYGMMQGINAGVAQNNANAVNQTTGKLTGAGLTALMSKGGVAGKDGYKMDDHHKKMVSIFHPHLLADGGEIPDEPDAPNVNVPNLQAPQDSGKSGSGMPDISSMMSMKTGGKIPGKAKVKGDSLKNDTIPALLSAGEIVLPRHVTTHKDAPKKAAEFVAAVLAKKGKRK